MGKYEGVSNTFALLCCFVVFYYYLYLFFTPCCCMGVVHVVSGLVLYLSCFLCFSFPSAGPDSLCVLVLFPFSLLVHSSSRIKGIRANLPKIKRPPTDSNRLAMQCTACNGLVPSLVKNSEEKEERDREN